MVQQHLMGSASPAYYTDLDLESGSPVAASKRGIAWHLAKVAIGVCAGLLVLAAVVAPRASPSALVAQSQPTMAGTRVAVAAAALAGTFATMPVAAEAYPAPPPATVVGASSTTSTAPLKGYTLNRQAPDLMSKVTGGQDLDQLVQEQYNSIKSAPTEGSSFNLPNLSNLPNANLGLIAAAATALGLWALTRKPSQTQYASESEAMVAITRNYDPEKAKEYFASRPFTVLRRFLEGLYLTNGLIIGIVLDKRLGNVEKNEAKRAQKCREVAVKLGPTFIKLGQALSIRPDLIPKAYSEELRQLQDAVPPFDSDAARAIIAQELGVTESALSTIFTGMSQEPVASASIGQVYKATLKDGREVAVKVQRPGVPGIIALDLFLVRTLAPVYQKLTGSDGDLRELVDEWGKGFVDELDYKMEAINTDNFRMAMAERGLDSVTAPEVVPELSGSRVLTTMWVDGCRLDVSQEDDVPRLCGVALNAYLAMLLDTGTLHCDPHPGNLLRMSDGRLCILDWGMTTEVQPGIQYSLIEYIAHIISEDYDKLPTDFVNLGFLVPEKEDEIRKSGTLAPLTYMLKQLSQGGGPKKVRERIFEEYREKYPGRTDEELRTEMRTEMKNRVEEERRKQGVDVGSITYKVEEMQNQNKEAFRIPPYFLYISRAFATLEGIGLQMDENYSILQECYPYLARRLLSDTSPRAEGALRSLLYGTGNTLNPASLTKIASGFSEYTKSTSSVTAGAGQGLNSEALWKGAELLLDPKGNVIQQILVDEAAGAISGSVKDVLRSRIVQPAAQIGEALGPLKPLATPFLLPAELLSPFTQKRENEENSLRLFGTLFNRESEEHSDVTPANKPEPAALTLPSAPVPLPSTTQIQSTLSSLDQETVQNLQRLQPGVTALGGRFVNSLLKEVGANLAQVVNEPEEHQQLPGLVNELTKAVLANVENTQQSVEQSLPGAKQQEPVGRR